VQSAFLPQMRRAGAPRRPSAAGSSAPDISGNFGRGPKKGR
jgi:hypothetical protein